MIHSPRHLEGLAREVFDVTGLEAPVDAFALLEACGLSCRPWGKAIAEIDIGAEMIRYPIRARPERVQRLVLHEVGHWVLQRAGESDEDEEDVDYLALALLLPRAHFLADLGELGHDLPAIKARHPNASHEAIAVRIVQLSPAFASVWDAGHLHRTYGERDPDNDRALVDCVLSTGKSVRGDVSAFAVFDGSYRRVIVVGRTA